MPSDSEFLERFSDCWRAGKIFSCQHLDLNLSQQDLQNFENRSTDNVFMAKMNMILNRDFALAG